MRQPLRTFVIRFSSLQALLIAFALAGYPLVATFSTALGLNGTALAIGMRAIVLILSLLLVAPALSHIKNTQLKFLAIFFVFWAAYILRIYADTSLGSSSLSKPASEYWIWALGVCFIPSVALVGVNSSLTLPKAFYLAWITLGVAALLSILYGSTFATRLDGTQSDTGRLALDSLNPISTGHLGASLAIISGWYWWSAAQPTVVLKAASASGMLAGLYLLVSAASRGPLFALMCTIGIVLLTLKLKRMLKVATAIAVALAALTPIIFSYVDLETVQLMARIAASTSGEDQSVGSREDSFAGAWNQFLNNPLLGDFLEERSTGYYPHNLILEAFMSTGLGGGFAIVAMIIIATWRSFTIIQERQPYAWVGLIYIQYFIGAQLSGSLYSSNTFWIFSTLLIFLSRHKESKKLNFNGANPNKVIETKH